MKPKSFSILLAILMSMNVTRAFSYDIAVENSDGVLIYYNYINNGTELEVTKKSEEYSGEYVYIGNVVIPEEVTYMNRTRQVTSIKKKHSMVARTLPL